MGRWTRWTRRAELAVAQWELIDALNSRRTATGGWVVRLQPPEDEDAGSGDTLSLGCQLQSPKGRDLGAAAGACPAHSWPPCLSLSLSLSLSACVNISPSYLCHTAHKAGQLDTGTVGRSDTGPPPCRGPAEAGGLGQILF